MFLRYIRRVRNRQFFGGYYTFMKNRFAVILAAGQGTRMKSKLYKVLHPVCEKPMIAHIIDEVKQLNATYIVTIIGHGAEKVKETIGSSVSYALQAEQLGTAHAVMQAREQLADKDGVTLVVCGDTPLITNETMEQLIRHHEEADAKATILTAETPQPTGYGRIVRGEDGNVRRIVEEKDATDIEKEIQEINTGTYCFDNKSLFDALTKVKNDNSQGEYYLPDVIEILQKDSQVIAAFKTTHFDETIGVNDRVALSQAEAVMRKRINEHHMHNGVTIIDPANTYIASGVTIGQDTVIYPGTKLTGNVTIGEECTIGPHSEITDCQIGERTVIKQSVVSSSEIGHDVTIGPFAHIRPESVLGNNIKIGNFVEVKKSTLANGAKASHLSYIGDAELGKDVNIGCGTITVNYDGKNKHVTKVEDGAFIGCNTNLIAPVTVGRNAYVAAGSTITEHVPEQALSIARARQVNKENYVARIENNDEGKK